jgi:hypothetical protein
MIDVFIEVKPIPSDIEDKIEILVLIMLKILFPFASN